jgi:hypothetical protein
MGGTKIWQQRQKISTNSSPNNPLPNNNAILCRSLIGLRFSTGGLGGLVFTLRMIGKS